MSFRIILFPILICLLITSNLFADTFIVNSNADNGAGTLREALEKAAANGTGLTDSIFFNLPDVTRSGRTIVLASALPDLSSYIYLDGTSQPGAPFGISDARVQIQNFSSGYCFNAIKLTGIEIYGLYLKGNYYGAALNFRETNELHFGKPGKGNIVTGFGIAIYTDIVSSLPDSASSNLSFQSNLMGIDEWGDTADYITYNHTNFYLKNVRNVIIGGLGIGEGNLLCDNNMVLDLYYTKPDNAGYLKIEGNKIGTDRTGLKKLTPVGADDINISGYNDGTDYPDGTTDVDVEITNNISTGRLFMVKVKNYFKIRGNKLGVGADNTTKISTSYANTLFFSFCGQGIVGGVNSGDKNYIAYGDQGLGRFHCGSITISRNSFFCHTSEGISTYNWPFYTRPKPFITINAISSTQVGGTALPNSTIELFYDDDCPLCEGKTYFATVAANGNGNWVYNGSFNGAVVATATDTYGATSTFSTAVIDTDSALIKNATCGKSNGAIKGIRVVSGTDWHWENKQGLIVGSDSDLVNVPAGFYKFVTGIAGNGCITESMFYEVKAINRPSTDTTLISITHPNCGAGNGALQYAGLFNDTARYQWLNSLRTVVNNDYSTNNPFSNIWADKYYLHVSLTEDSTCFIDYGPFTLINQTGPTLNTSAAQISNATCGKNNGSVKNIRYQNTTGTVYAAWEDSAGKVVSNNMDLTMAPAGKYRLKFKDGSSCDTIVSPYYFVTDSGTIQINTTNMQVSPSGCLSATGSITNIIQTGAEQFRWIDIQTNVVMSNSLSLTNAPPATYELALTNHFGCIASAGPVNIMQSGFAPIAVTGNTLQHASCNLANGNILITQLDKDTLLYRFNWKDSNNNNLGIYTSLSKVAGGNYTLFATDNFGCQGKVFTATIQQLGIPVFDYNSLKISSDTCNNHVGSITGLQATGGSMPLTWLWTDAANNTIAANATAINNLLSNGYAATVRDQQGCVAKSNVLFVDNVSKLVKAPVVVDQLVPRNTSATIKVVNPGSGNYQLYNEASATTLLAAGIGGVFITLPVTSDRSFYIRYNEGDCPSALARINIKVFDSTIVYVPRAFTPNNDGTNDNWRVIVQGKLLSYSILIYNRYGKIVYSGTDVNDHWDGMLKGAPLPAGAFVYVINAKDYFNRLIKLSGSILLLR